MTDEEKKIIKNWKAGKIKLRVRKDLNLSQKMFAQILGVSKKTVETWEEGRFVPNGPSRRLMEIFQKDHEILQRQQILMVQSSQRTGKAQ